MDEKKLEKFMKRRVAERVISYKESERRKKLWKRIYKNEI